MNSNLLKTFGPGILFASTAIGVSHLVQSTRAGAEFGFALWWIIILANLMKYPFFEYGTRYASATGESIIDGYLKLGKAYFGLYIIITLCSMFFVTAAVGAVTAGFLDNLLGISELFPGFKVLSASLLFGVCVIILLLGKFKVLDSLIKVIASVMLIATVIAFILTLNKGPAVDLPSVAQSDIWRTENIAFIIALMGWMPTAVDLSAWNSLWTVARIKETGYHPKLKESLFDFNLGYVISALLSICFLTLGAFLIYGTGIESPNSSAAYASFVIDLYTQSIGQWSYFIIAIAGFAIMFGTSIGVFDGYARSLERCVELVTPKKLSSENSYSKYVYVFSVLITAGGGFWIIYAFSGQLKSLVDLATSISFVIAPVIAIINFRLVHAPYVSKEASPPLWLKTISYLGILYLTGFSVWFIYLKINL